MNLYKQLSNLQKVTATSVERARHVTLLQQLLQGGLLETLHRVNSDKCITQKLQVKLPIPEMNDVAWDEIVKKGLCVQVRFSNTTLKIGNTNGNEQNAGVRYLDGDFTHLLVDI